MAIGTEFNLRNLDKLDGGRIGAAFEHFFSQVVRDVAARPDIKKARKLNMILEVKPGSVDIDAGRVTLEDIEIQAKFKPSVPIYGSKVYTMDPQENGKLHFNPDRPDNEPTLMDGEEREEDDAA